MSAIQSHPLLRGSGNNRNYLAPPLRSKTYRRFDGETWQEDSQTWEELRRHALPPRCVFCGGPALVRADDGNYLCRLCAAERGLK